MIAQVLNRDFVLERLKEVQDFLSSPQAEERRTAAEGGPDLDPLDRATAAEALALAETALASETAQSSGQPGFEPPPAERRGEESAPIDDFSFFSRDASVSNLQSALEQYFAESQRETLEAAEPPDDRRSDPWDEVAVTDVSLAGVPPSRELDGRRVFDKFSVTDARWVSSLFAMGVRRFRDRYPFPDKPAEPLRIGDRARLVLVGDWGSGIPRARKVADQMRKVIDEGVQSNREQHVVHLGDVYYSGWEYEYRDRFLKYWPVKESEKDSILSWNLNGNHDMYSGGHAFFGHALRDPRFARQQGSSWFSLQNDHWTILGLDTAWEEHGLQGNQAEWAKQRLESSPGKGLLLSHHQVFSSYEKKKEGAKEPALVTKIRPVLATGRVRSWFWGHEHRCVLYKPYENVAFARCIGHGGVPVYMTHGEKDPYPPPGDYEYRGYFQKGLERWAWFGFAVLDFEGAEIHVRYIDENGVEHKNERIA
ncbi:MAG TPA: metallophosphoesterase [Thermoanaerobaculia bacterium]|nr:metallophosphoesterase [Thermoanaerobaculia bacterium]